MVSVETYQAGWYVVDLDIKGFFDNIDHEQMMAILRKHTSQKHILLYCERWLKAAMYKQNGELQTRSLEQSHFILDKLKERLKRYSLEIHPDKTRMVFCYQTERLHKDGKKVPVSFDFLGFTFKPRLCKKPNGEMCWGFRPAISMKSQKKIIGELRRLAIHSWVSLDIQSLAEALAPKIRGWINYFGRFRISELQRVFRLLNIRIAKWARKKYKLKTYSKSYGWLKRIIRWYPNTFVHWKYGFIG